MNKRLIRSLQFGYNCFNVIKAENRFKQLLILPVYENTFNIKNYNCWSCNRKLNEKEYKSPFCPCEKILPTNKNINYYELFNLDIDYNIDRANLTKRFRQLMRKLHPDLYTQDSEIEKKYSADQSSLVNKAYRVLSSPIQRGLYMLELVNEDYEKEATETHETDSERNKILMEILELNELIDEIKRPEEVEELENKLEEIMGPFEKELENAFKTKDYKLAVSILSKMKYFKNVNDRLMDLKLKFNLVNA